MKSQMVEVRGFEPLTPCVQSRCSPSELHPLGVSSIGVGFGQCQRGKHGLLERGEVPFPAP